MRSTVILTAGSRRGHLGDIRARLAERGHISLRGRLLWKGALEVPVADARGGVRHASACSVRFAKSST